MSDELFEIKRRMGELHLELKERIEKLEQSLDAFRKLITLSEEQFNEIDALTLLRKTGIMLKMQGEIDELKERFDRWIGHDVNNFGSRIVNIEDVLRELITQLATEKDSPYLRDLVKKLSGGEKSVEATAVPFKPTGGKEVDKL